MTQAIFDLNRICPLFTYLPKPLPSLGFVIFPYVHVMNRFSRRFAHPYLFATGAALNELFPNEKFLSITSTVVALANRILSVRAAITELQESFFRLKSIRLIPSPPALTFFLLSKNSFETTECHYFQYARETLKIIFRQFNAWLNHLQNVSWKLMKLIFHIYSLTVFFFWTKEDMKDATQDLFINLKECGDFLFEKSENWEHIERAIEEPITSFLSFLGLQHICEPLLSTTRNTLPLIPTQRLS